MRLARTRAAGALLRFMFRRAAFLIPVRRLVKSRRLLVLRHPAPAYPAHILIVPRRGLRGLADLREGDGALLAEVLRVSAQLADELSLGASARLVVNGGAFQEAGILHFHLIGGKFNETFT